MKQLFTVIAIFLSFSLFGQVVQNGDEFSITVPVQNNGPGTEPNAKVNFTIPQGVSYVDDDPTQGFYTTSDNSWRVHRLFPNQNEKITVTFEVNDISQFPVSITATASGDYLDITPGNNDSTYIIEQVANLIDGEAINWTYGSVSGNVFNNDTLCNYCSTKAYLAAGSAVNGTVEWFDSLSGDYRFQFDDPNLDASFDYDLFCYDCGDGVEYSQNTATEDIPALFTKPFPEVDTSEVYRLNADTVVHVAGGDTTYIVDNNGIYSGDGTISSNRVVGMSTNNIRFEDGDSYTELRKGDYRIGQEPDPMFGGGYETIFNHSSINATNNTVPQFNIVTGNTSISLVEGVLTLRLDNTYNTAWNTPNQGLEYNGFANYDNLQANSLVPKQVVEGIVSDSVSRNELLSTSGDQIVLTQTVGPNVATNITGLTSISNLLDSQVVDVAIVEIDSATKRLALYFNNGDSLTALFNDYGGGSGSFAGVTSDSTLSGNGTGASALTVSETNNNLVSSFEMDGNDIIIILTTGDTLRLTQAELQAAINTTELTNASYGNDTIFIQDDNQIWVITGFDSTLLSNVSLSNDSLLVEDDGQVWGVDLSGLRTTSLAWSSITSKPTVTQSGGNITGTIDLSAETFTLNYNDVDTNYHLDTAYIEKDTAYFEVSGVDTFALDLTGYNNTSTAYLVSSILRDMNSSIYTINMESSYKHVDIISYTAASVSGGVAINCSNDMDGGTIVLHIDEDEEATFNDYFVTPNLVSLGTYTFVRNTTLVFDVVNSEALGLELQPDQVTSNGNILILRRWDVSSDKVVQTAGS